MRVLKVIAILVVGPLLGVVFGLILGGLLLPPDPSGRGAPGDGFLVMLCAGIGRIDCRICDVGRLELASLR